MAKEEKNIIILEGVVKETLPGGKFTITVDFNGIKKDVEGYLSGKMRLHYIRLIEGDKVRVEMSSYDITRARIIYRLK